ncbi:DUF1643 domain-containing protein [Salinarimonas rosea]|uniref:DUF1643 domain-containing protein n=1 Tax=Salinarimonas rosea TaxID=552063 RepID=UPI00040357F1|nr:DUF1643 domain-containing protein [Salinarimonas rosea]
MSAVFSPCGTYRYRLERPGDDARAGAPALAFVMLNPSTADAYRDDPTIRRVRLLARGFGYGPVVVANLYGLRSADPRALAAHPDPVGPETPAHLAAIAAQVRDVVCAWGNHAEPARARAALALLAGAGARLWHLGLTKSGAPRHPLYVPRDVPLTMLVDESRG